MAKAIKAEKKKRATRHVARVPCRDAEELATLHAIAKRRGLTFSGMIHLDYLKVKLDTVPTPYEDALNGTLKVLKDLFNMIKGWPVELQTEFIPVIYNATKDILKAKDDSKVQQPRKRRKADGVYPKAKG